MEKGRIEESLQGIQSENARIRNRHFKALLPVSEGNPELLYPYWDVFVRLLRRVEVSCKYVAIHLAANLVRVDSDNRFEELFDEFYRLLLHESPVVSPHIAGVSGKIVQAKPHLSREVTSRLLEVDRVSRCKQKELMKSYVIDAFDDYFDEIEEKGKVVEFVRSQLNSDSPKTRKRARQFLEKWGTGG